MLKEFEVSINKLKDKSEVYKQDAIFSSESKNFKGAFRSLGYYLGLQEAIQEMKPYIDKLKSLEGVK